MRSEQRVCVQDRQVFRASWFGGSFHCPTCRQEGIEVSYRWRAPKKDNDKAWALIESGDWLWDKRHLAKRTHNVRLPEEYTRGNPKYRKSEIEVDLKRPTRR